MTWEGYSVFLSSTSDLEVERREVADRAPQSFRVYRYERDRARRQSPEARLRQVLETETDVYLGLYGERYGSPYPDCRENRSIVEWEFDTARTLPVEVLGFVKEPLDEDRLEPLQARFLERIRDFRRGHWLGRFSSSEGLARDVNTALLEWLNEVHERERQAWMAERERRGRRDRLLFAVAGTVTVVALLTAVQNGAWWSAAAVLALAALQLFAAARSLADEPIAQAPVSFEGGVS